MPMSKYERNEILKLLDSTPLKARKYAKMNEINVFLKPTVNSKGFFEKGVGMVRLDLVLKSMNAIEIAIRGSIAANKCSLL